MTLVEIFIPGKTPPKPRARFSRYGPAYTPKEHVAWERSAGAIAQRACRHLREPFTGPLSLRVEVFLLRPASAKKRVHPAVKPDLDNFLKSLDFANGIVWKDDGQIVELWASKVYVDDESKCGLYIRAQEICKDYENEGKKSCKMGVICG